VDVDLYLSTSWVLIHVSAVVCVFTHFTFAACSIPTHTRIHTNRWFDKKLRRKLERGGQLSYLDPSSWYRDSQINVIILPSGRSAVMRVGVVLQTVSLWASN